ncbi:GNAT family N-acetyltransferase [Vineibacter terrae]|uniref:GNAT family N-acetyltransferase n=1 Tax=Vineibacter terrae TaxID=2586908 RepID=A0A5C8PSG6_9HYPH|nr:GNAT family N-acetyltransferase [Vineibacter terrae]TXL78745.1 GNAT family N-acetyltransferase [Vineibacter terrae]
MSAFDIRILGAGDEPRLEAFFADNPDLTLFQRSNLRHAGAIDDGRRYGGTYAAALVNDEVVGVVAHYWNGNVMPLVPSGGHDVRVLLDAALAASGRKIVGVVGSWDQVAATLMHPTVRGRIAKRCAREILFALPLTELVVPQALSAGDITVRSMGDDDLPLLAAWRVEYLVEMFDLPRTATTWDVAAQDVAALHAEGRAWVVEAQGRPVAFTGFNAALPDVVQVGGVYTPPFGRARGFARVAVAGSLLRARQAGADRAVLFTDVSNNAAQRAYRALGFEPIDDWGLVRF